MQPNKKFKKRFGKTTQTNQETKNNKIAKTNKIISYTNIESSNNFISNDYNPNEIIESQKYPLTLEQENLFNGLNWKPPSHNNFCIDFSKIKPVGLINLNFSCYMNSCLQCFYHCKLFINEILNNKDKIKYKNSPIANALINLVEDLNLKGTNSSLKIYQYYPKNFYDTVLQKYPKFKNSFGNDPKAISLLILLFMPQELQPEFSYRTDKSINKNNEETLFEDIYKKYNKSYGLFSDNFYWCLKKKKICKNCKKKNKNNCYTYSFQYNHMHDFYISQICRNLKSSTCTLNDCFNKFKEPDEENSIEFMCYNCGKKVIANRILYYMATLPNYLVICINDEGSLSKYYNLKVEPVINLGDIFNPTQNYTGSRETNYEFHCGVFIRGNKTHAIAICRHFDNQFYEFDDRYFKVYDIREKLKYEIPYLMFYRRKDIPA